MEDVRNGRMDKRTDKRTDRRTKIIKVMSLMSYLSNKKEFCKSDGKNGKWKMYVMDGWTNGRINARTDGQKL